MKTENHLFAACRVLFGDDIEISKEFLAYIQENGVNSAFKKKAMEVHPDRCLLSNLSLERCQEEFVALQVACETLLQHIVSRERNVSTARSEMQLREREYTFHKGLPEEKLLFGRFLYRMNIIEWRHLLRALAWQKTGRPKIGELGIKLGYLDRSSVLTILKKSIKAGPFGVTAFNLGLLSKDEVYELLRRQKRQEKKIGQFFIEQGLLSEMELQQLLWQCAKHNLRIERIVEK